MQIKTGKTIRITTDDKIEVLEIPWTFEDYEQAINAECTELVRTRPSFSPIVMLVDESGLMKDKPVNKAASIMYGAIEHGACIVGDVMLVELIGPEMVPIEEEELKLVKNMLLNMFPFLEEVEK